MFCICNMFTIATILLYPFIAGKADSPPPPSNVFLKLPVALSPMSYCFRWLQGGSAREWLCDWKGGLWQNCTCTVFIHSFVHSLIIKRCRHAVHVWHLLAWCTQLHFHAAHIPLLGSSKRQDSVCFVHCCSWCRGHTTAVCKHVLLTTVNVHELPP